MMGGWYNAREYSIVSLFNCLTSDIEGLCHARAFDRLFGIMMLRTQITSYHIISYYGHGHGPVRSLRTTGTEGKEQS